MERTILEQLFELQDLSYKEFHVKLIPTVNPDTIIGVRTPQLRKLTKEFAKDMKSADFLKELPHKYYEENNMHGFLIEQIKDYDACIQALHDFLPFVDNWATCDMMSPKILKKHLPELLGEIKVWLRSEHTYAVRFGIKMLMDFYLEEFFAEEYLEWVANVQSEEYYIRMMKAWYFATALAKQYESAVCYLEEKKMDGWTHNKTIQKAVESYRISKEQKEYLKTLKRR